MLNSYRGSNHTNRKFEQRDLYFQVVSLILAFCNLEANVSKNYKYFYKTAEY